jgi:tRNA nucleotidyltransferase (CCA-adding enzyme)
MYVSHNIIATYANDKVNVKRDDVKEYRDQVGRLRTRLKEYIDAHPDYGLVKSLHSGSLAKGTALKTLNDMDVAVYVEKSEAPSEEKSLLGWMEERLREAVRPLGIKDDQVHPEAHCIRLEYRGSGLSVDVVPVLYEGDADDVGYLITKDTGDRVKTSVKLHREFIKTRKDAQVDDFAQVVRLVKWWIRQRKLRDDDFRFKSFMAELICAHLADDGLDMSDYPEALERFFAYIVRSELKERIAFTDYYALTELPNTSFVEIEVFDPVNAENNVASRYSSTDRTRIVSAATDALDALSEARFVGAKGRAVDLWRKVLGPSFNG